MIWVDVLRNPYLAQNGASNAMMVIWVDVLRNPYLAQNGASNAMMVR